MLYERTTSMDRSSDTTSFSPTPFSPFSDAPSFGSEGGTSDEPADLGQFATIFRALNELQPRAAGSRAPARASSLPRGGTPASSMFANASGDDSDAGENEDGPSTVWTQNTIAQYLASSAQAQNRRPENGDQDEQSPWDREADNDVELDEEDEDTEGDEEGEETHGLPPEADEDQPSLGFLDEALGFLAAERAKYAALREAGQAQVQARAMDRRSNASNASGSRSVGARAGASTNGAGSSHSQSESAWRHVIEPRRKRRRKRGKGAATNGADSVGGPEAPLEAGDGEGEGAADGTTTPVGDALDASSSGAEFDFESGGMEHGKSMPATPPRALRQQRGSGRRAKASAPLLGPALSSNSQSSSGPSAGAPGVAQHPLQKLSHSRSTPSLRLALPTPATDPRVLRFRALATKLRMLFVEDAKTLSHVLLNLNDASVDPETPEGGSTFVDTRGNPPVEGDTLVHVFIDYSNILIGFLNHLRRYPHPSRRHSNSQAGTGRPPLHMSHSALALILERGRPVTRRVLAASSPLYQPMDGAVRLGYEVRVYARVPDVGDVETPGSKEREQPRGPRDRDLSPTKKRKSAAYAVMNGSGSGHSRKSSGTAVGTPSATQPPADSEPASAGPVLPAGALAKSHSRNTSLTNASQPGTSFLSLSQSTPLASPAGGPTRVRYREQGVDELLQLKLLQAIADVDGAPPPGATIVLATGDGNAGQFNEDGFRGCVRTALRRGWMVELYAWEVGLSKSWTREFGEAGLSGGDVGSYARGGAGSGSGGSGDEGRRFKGQFRIVGLERFASDLLEIL